MTETTFKTSVIEKCPESKKMTSARRDSMRNDGFWEESVKTMKIWTSCKEELCPLRFQQLLSTSLFVTREKTMLNI